jgi:signal transduction histidine kinase
MTIIIQPIIELCDGDRNAELQITTDFYYECANNIYRIINAFVTIDNATPDEIGGLLGTIKSSSHLLKGVMSTLSMKGMADYFTQLEKIRHSELTITTYFDMKNTIIDTIRNFNTIVLEINTRYELEYRVVTNIDYKDRYSDILNEQNIGSFTYSINKEEMDADNKTDNLKCLYLSDHIKSVYEIDKDQLIITPLLGLTWILQSDVLNTKQKLLDSCKSLTTYAHEYSILINKKKKRLRLFCKSYLSDDQCDYMWSGNVIDITAEYNIQTQLIIYKNISMNLADITFNLNNVLDFNGQLFIYGNYLVLFRLKSPPSNRNPEINVVANVSEDSDNAYDSDYADDYKCKGELVSLSKYATETEILYFKIAVNNSFGQRSTLDYRLKLLNGNCIQILGKEHQKIDGNNMITGIIRDVTLLVTAENKVNTIKQEFAVVKKNLTLARSDSKKASAIAEVVHISDVARLASAEHEVKIIKKEIAVVENKLIMARSDSKNASDRAALVHTNDVAKTDFLKYVFHEARNQLNIVTVGVDNIIPIHNYFIQKLALYENKTPQQLELIDNLKITLDILNDVAMACTNTITIFNDTLDLQKIQENKMEYCYEYVSIWSRLKTYVENIQRAYIDKSITITGECDHIRRSLFYMDGTKIYQAITNIINNACKFTKDMVTISFRTENDVDIENETTLIVDVIDNGIDFDESLLDKLFKPYSQLRNGIKMGGSGLGLHIAKTFVENQGGELTVKRENDTTIFTISIKCKYKLNDDLNETEPSKFDPDQLCILNPYVLIVEDSVIIRKMYGVMFDQLKIKYDTAENGKLAIDKVATAKYDVILMDKEMPVMGGYEATREILKINPKQVIIGLTGNALVEQQLEFMECGLSDILIKPVNQEHLLSTIYKFIS